MITLEQKRAYDEDGVVCLRGLIDPHWLEVAARAIDYGRANPGPMYLDYSQDTRPRTYEADFWVWQDNMAMRAFIFDSPAAAIAGALMNVASVMLVTDNWLMREAGAVNHAPWHHDGPYFDLDGQWCVLWMALEPVSPGEGVVFLKGSHRWNRQFMPESFTGSGPKGALTAPFEPTPDFTSELQRHEVLEFSLAPGDCLCFDRLTVHGVPDPAPATRSSRRFTFRFADGAARYRRRGPWTKDMTVLLEQRYGLVEGGPYCCELLPILWQSDPTSPSS